MKITGIEGMTVDEINHEYARGGRFVFYQFCISAVFMSFKRSSSIYFIKGGHSKVAKGLPFTLLSFVAGWWGIPWGPIWTIATMITNLGGGKDVTDTVLTSINQTAAARAAASTPPSFPANLPRQTL